MIYVTTDTHFNHKSIIQLADRPINFESKLRASFSSLTKEDVLIHLGDICMGKSLAVHESEIIPIKAKKILVLGNHDPKSVGWYLEHGWDFVCESFTNKYFGVKVKFTHKPVPWDGDFDVNLHGHLHNLSHRSEVKTNGLNYLVSLEKIGYSLISLEHILEPIRDAMNKSKESEENE